MTLCQAVDAFLALKQSLGARYAAEGRILRAFARTMGDIGLEEIQPDAVRAFCRGSGPPTQWLVRKHYALQVFFKHLALRGHIGASPLPEAPPRVPRSFRPRIFSQQELARLLEGLDGGGPEQRSSAPQGNLPHTAARAVRSRTATRRGTALACLRCRH